MVLVFKENELGKNLYISIIDIVYGKGYEF